VKYGVKEDLLTITQIKGVGRIRARILSQNGYRNFSDFRNQSVEDIAKISSIGKSLARDIITQITKFNSKNSIGV